MVDVQHDCNESDNDPENDLTALRVPALPLGAPPEALSDLSHLRHPEQEIDPPLTHLVENRIRRFSVEHVLLHKRLSLCWNANSGRYFVEGKTQAEALLHVLVPEIKVLPADHTLAIDSSKVTATADFVHTLVSHLFSPESPYHSYVASKQVVFFDVDSTTALAVHLSLISGGRRNVNCLVAETSDTIRWRLRLLGNLEPHLGAVLDYARRHKSFRAQDLIDDGYSNQLGNATTRVHELWKMGLVRRVKVEKPLHKSGRREFCYLPYHPYLDLQPTFPINLLRYTDEVPEMGLDFSATTSP